MQSRSNNLQLYHILQRSQLLHKLKLPLWLFLPLDLRLERGNLLFDPLSAPLRRDALPERRCACIPECLARDPADEVLIDGIHRQSLDAQNYLPHRHPVRIVVPLHPHACTLCVRCFFVCKSKAHPILPHEDKEDVIRDRAINEAQNSLINLPIVQTQLEYFELLHLLPCGEVQNLRRNLVTPVDGCDLLAERLFERGAELTLFIKFLFWNPSVAFRRGRQSEHVRLLSTARRGSR